MDFTLRKYEQLCVALVTAGYQSMGMGDFIAALTSPPNLLSEGRGGTDINPLSHPLENEGINMSTSSPFPRRGVGGEVSGEPKKIILLRHDVDSRPQHALKMAEIEKAHGLTATYFFRTVGTAYDPHAVQQTYRMGHEVGYHYETLSQAGGDLTKAIALFASELAKLRESAPVKIASMHGSPLKPWDNRAIWERVKPQEFGLVGEVYRDIDYQRVVYLSDTGRSWNPTRYNVRDVTGVIPPFHAESTDDVIALLPDPAIRHLCLLTHPERWQDEPLAWTLQAARDVLTNYAKVIIKRIYGKRRN